MLKSTFVQKLKDKLVSALPQELQAAQDAFKAQCQAIILSTLTQCGGVTREEFDVQKKVLERTRKQVEALHQQLAELEESRKP